ncbi:hypothetical protein BS78_02G049100 [Paspalum vaginatum]|nr:hypothetical protein BS78_02G049100 [Paspalum vaginatum]
MALKPNLCRLLAAATLLLLLAAPPAARGQPQPPQGSPAPCTAASLVTSFTPCFSYLTNSSGGAGAAPTQDCCRSLAALMNASAGCACLVLAGGVPLGLPAGLPPVNHTLAVALPRACGSAAAAAVPLQCGGDNGTSVDAPAAPGPAADAPSQLTPPEPEAPAAPEAPATTPADPAATAPVSQGQTRPAVLPSSARRRASARVPAAFLLLLAAGAALV